MVDNLYHTQTKTEADDDHPFPIAPELLQDAQAERETLVLALQTKDPGPEVEGFELIHYKRTRSIFPYVLQKV